MAISTLKLRVPTIVSTIIGLAAGRGNADWMDTLDARNDSILDAHAPKVPNRWDFYARAITP